MKQVSQCSAILKQMFHVKHSKGEALFANENPEASRPRESQPGYRTCQKSISARQSNTVAQKRPSPPPPDAKRSRLGIVCYLFSYYFERNFYRNFFVQFNDSFVSTNFFHSVFYNDDLSVDLVAQFSQFLSDLDVTNRTEDSTG